VDSFDPTLYVQYVRQRHQKWRHDEDQSRTVQFESDMITLDLPDSVVDHWKIVPMTPPQVVII